MYQVCHMWHSNLFNKPHQVLHFSVFTDENIEVHILVITIIMELINDRIHCRFYWLWNFCFLKISNLVLLPFNWKISAKVTPMFFRSQTNPSEQMVQASQVEASTVELSLRWTKGGHMHTDAPPRKRWGSNSPPLDRGGPVGQLLFRFIGYGRRETMSDTECRFLPLPVSAPSPGTVMLVPLLRPPQQGLWGTPSWLQEDVSGRERGSPAVIPFSSPSCPPSWGRLWAEMNLPCYIPSRSLTLRIMKYNSLWLSATKLGHGLLHRWRQSEHWCIIVDYFDLCLYVIIIHSSWFLVF